MSISMNALESMVQKCVASHQELTVNATHIQHAREGIVVDIKITLPGGVNIPLTVNALQKQIKKYLEACSGVMVQEVRVFVDSTIPADEKTEASPYAIPTALLGLDPVGKPEKQDEPEPQTEEQQGAEAECGAEPEADEPETKADDTAEETAQEDERQTAEQEQGEQA